VLAGSSLCSLPARTLGFEAGEWEAVSVRRRLDCEVLDASSKLCSLPLARASLLFKVLAGSSLCSLPARTLGFWAEGSGGLGEETLLSRGETLL
jgi:hypothetical protein